MYLHDENGELIGIFPPQSASCLNSECENYEYEILVPDHPSVTLQCGVCGNWIIHPVVQEVTT